MVRAAGMGDVSFKSDAFKEFSVSEPAHVIITAAKSSSNFSHDTYTIPKTILNKDFLLVESRALTQDNQIDATVEGKEIVIRGMLSSESAVASHIYLNMPNGTVQEYAFDPDDTQKSGILRTGTPVEKRINISEAGEYVVEVNDNKGFAVLNKAVYSGDVLPLAPNREDVVQKREFSHYEASVAQSASLGYINEFRKKLGFGSVQFDANLQKLAMLKAQDMAAHNYVGHTDSS